MNKSADTVIIGAGPGGYVAGIRLAQLGQRVVVVEKARVGGVCLNRGCIPVKALLHSAAIIRNAAEARVMGIGFGPPKIDLVSLGMWKNRIVERLVRGIEFLFKGNGVELIRGKANLKDNHTVVVTGEQEVEVTGHNLVIATGSKPAVLEGLTVDQNKVIDSDGALNLVELPSSMMIIGAGAVGLEFATIFNRLGVKVTVMEICEQILPGIDHDFAIVLQRQMEREGIEFQLGVKGIRCEPGDSKPGLRVCWEGGGKTQELMVNQMLVAVGREPLSGELGLESVGVRTDERGFIKTEDNYRTNVDGIYAIGDVRGGSLLAHKAMYEGLMVAEIIAGRRNYSGGGGYALPMVVYTDPEFATVGLSQSQAEKQGRKVRVSRVPLNAIGRSLTLNRSEGMAKLVVEEKTGKILGASILAPQADVLIAEAAVAVELGLTAEELGRVVHPHPTMSELLFEASEAVLGKAIHILNR